MFLEVTDFLSWVEVSLYVVQLASHLQSDPGYPDTQDPLSASQVLDTGVSTEEKWQDLGLGKDLSEEVLQHTHGLRASYFSKYFQW